MMEENKVAAARLYQLAQLFKPGETASDLRIEDLTLAEFEDVLDEVQGFVKSIDVAQELHSIGLLADLFHHVLYYPHAGIRAKTAELVTTMVKNNPKSQQLVMEVNGLQPLLYNFISDYDATSRTKALGAISALIQNNHPGITAFRLANGYAALHKTFESENVMLLREVLNLILYLIHENSSDNNTLIELGFHHSMIYLALSIADVEVREAALRALLVLAKDEGGNNGKLVKNNDSVKKDLRHLIEIIIEKAPEDLDVTRKEIQLADSLWNVASKLFEPPLRGAWAAHWAAEDASVSEDLDVASKLVAANRNFVSEKKEASLLLNARVKNDNKLKQVLRELKLVLHEWKQVPQERIERIFSSLKPEDLGATRVERHLVDSLWNACYYDGILELFGMAAYEHYAAKKLFEPPLREWVAADRNSVGEKKEASLPINVGVKNLTERTFFTCTKSKQPRSLFPTLRTAPNRSVRCGLSVLFGFAKCIRFGR